MFLPLFLFPQNDKSINEVTNACTVPVSSQNFAISEMQVQVNVSLDLYFEMKF